MAQPASPAVDGPVSFVPGGWEWQTPSPHGSAAARRAIRDYYARRTPALALEPDDVFLTASTSEAYSLLFALLTEPGDNILAPVVSYPLFEYLAAIHHVELRPYALDEQCGCTESDGLGRVVVAVGVGATQAAEERPRARRC